MSEGSPNALAQDGARYNILMIVTDQERYFTPADLPDGYRLPGHEKLASRGVVFEIHQVASCVCTPSRAVIYTGQHIQNNGMFGNTNFPWSNDLSTDISTADHGELAGAHGLSGKRTTGYREQLHVPFILSHPGYPGDKRCKAVTSHLDIAATLVGMAGGQSRLREGLAGSDISTLLGQPEAAPFDAIRPGALFNENMFAYIDSDLLMSVSRFIREGGGQT